MITVNFKPEINSAEIANLLTEIKNDSMGGWFDLPLNVDKSELRRIHETAERISEEADYLVCIGIGGSYLGHRAIIESLTPKSSVKIVYAGNSLSARELERTVKEIGDADFSVLVISKSGTTREPAVAFEKFKELLVEKYGESGALERIYATTDAKKGQLHDEATKNGYTRFEVPDNIGGRYSVLSPVGLLPLAVAGVDIEKLLDGAAILAEETKNEMAKFAEITEVEPVENNVENPVENSGTNSATETSIFASNPAVSYATFRHILFEKGYDTEVFASFEPATLYFNEWLKQLFGESEGKNRQGIFPASVIYSTDLHSMGQFMQDGRRNLFETIIDFPTDPLNAKVVQAVRTAHAAGGIPVLNIAAGSYDEQGFGELIFFFELSCALSAKLSGVNPFDQPGVEAYKTELKKLMNEA